MNGLNYQLNYYIKLSRTLPIELSYTMAHRDHDNKIIESWEGLYNEAELRKWSKIVHQKIRTLECKIDRILEKAI